MFEKETEKGDFPLLGRYVKVCVSISALDVYFNLLYQFKKQPFINSTSPKSYVQRSITIFISDIEKPLFSFLRFEKTIVLISES